MAQKRRRRAAPPAAVAPSPEPLAARLARPWPATLAGAVLGLLALGLYLRTLAPTITLVDAGELAVAAQGLGVPHPPGTPVWALLGHLATLVPLGSVAVRLNAFSAVCTAVAAGLLVVAWRALRATRPGPVVPGPAGFAPLLPALVAGALLALARTPWAYATVTEVYALNTALLAGLLGLVAAGRAPGSGWRPWAAACVVLGLGLGVHHVTVVVSLPALAALGWPRRTELTRRRALTGLALAAGTAAAAYAYLPWASSRAPLLDWGRPDSLARLLAHVSGRQYSSYLDTSGAALAQQLGVAVRLLSEEWGLVTVGVAALALVGLAGLRRRDPWLFRGALLLFACNLSVKAVYGIAEDQEAYLLPTTAGLALLAGFGAERLAARAAAGRARWAALALGPALAAGAGLANLAVCDRARYRVAETFVEDALSSLPPGGLLLTAEWQLYSPWLYYREVEGRRRDVLLVDVSLLRRSWYFDLLRRQAPELMRRATPAVDAYMQDLLGWEREPAPYDRDPALNRRINERFQAMVLGLLAAHDGPRAATLDVVIPASSPDPSLANLLGGRYGLVPQGLVMELLPRDQAPAAPRETRLLAGGLFDGSLRLAPDGVEALKVRPAYLVMAANRGRYLEATGRSAEAAAAYRQALAWDAGYAFAAEALARLERAARP